MNIRAPLGKVALPGEIRSSRAKGVQRYLVKELSPYFRLTEYRMAEHTDVLIVDVDVSVSQRRTVDIRQSEPVELLFDVDTDSFQGCSPLRVDFPIDVLHVMVGSDGTHPSLCLWDVPFEELKPRFTPYTLLVRVKEWLEKAADGTLHEEGQALEPVLLGSGVQIIVPNDIENSAQRYTAVGSSDKGLGSVFRFVVQNPEEHKQPACVLATFNVPAMTHRAVRYAPSNLAQLQSLLAEVGFDLCAELKSWAASLAHSSVLRNAALVILLVFPKKRVEEGPVESKDYWAFMCNKANKVSDVGEALGAFADASSFGIDAVGLIIGDTSVEYQHLEKFNVFAVSVRRELESEALPLLSGFDDLDCPSITAIGAGAIGSKVIELAARCGFGRWTVIDKDVFFPHNAVRHVLGSWAAGSYKAESLCFWINQLVPGAPVCEAIVADIKNPGSRKDDLEKALSGAGLILDMSASVVAARQLCEIEAPNRRASLFLNPTGKDVILLIEDETRSVSLWDLEAAYYASLVNEPLLDSHLNEEDPSARYGNGCRDLTARISAAQISMLSGIAFTQLTKRLQNSSSSVGVWRSDLQNGGVRHIEIASVPGLESRVGNWRIRWNIDVLKKLREQRRLALPSETGGVLIGLVDLEHNMIVVSMAIPAPMDSVKRPHYFERGIEGLEDILKNIDEKTKGQLRYIGEWHSHPDGVQVCPSADDENVFNYLSKCFELSCEPCLMTIMGSDEAFIRMGIDGTSSDALFSFLNCDYFIEIEEHSDEVA